jgi:hypothetical protein
MSNITSGHINAFKAVRSQHYKNITLESCTINGEEGVCIVMVDFVGEAKVAIMPLFVAITPTMKLDFRRRKKSRHGGGGGPKNPRENVQPQKPPPRPAPG